MPAKSQAQRRYLFATKGAAWVKEHHFDNKGQLPEHANNDKRHQAALAHMRKKHGSN